MKNYSIAECCDILDNKRVPLNKQQRQKIQGKIPYYGANGVQDFISDYIFDDDLILIAEDGGNFEQFATRPIAYRITGKSWVNNHAHVLRAREGFDQNVIFYSLVNKNILSFIVGGTRSKLNQTALRSITLSLPEYKEQLIITEILTTVDLAIERTEALIAKHERIKTGMVQDLLTRGIDEDGQLRDQSTNKFKSTPLGIIPEEWRLKTLGNVAVKIQDGTHFSPKSKEGPIRYITSKNIRFGYLDITETEWISQSEHDEIYKRCDVKKGDLLLTKDGANTGNATINPLDEPFSLLSSVVLIRCDGITAHSDFIMQYILSIFGQKRIKDLMAGNAITRLTLVKIRSFIIPLPIPKEQRIIADILNAKDMEIKSLWDKLSKLKSLKTGLMQDLLSGKVSVMPLLENLRENE